MPISTLSFKRPPAHIDSLTNLSEANISFPKASPHIEFVILSDVVGDYLPSIFLPTASVEAEHVSQFLAALTQDASDRGLTQPNALQLNDFLLHLLSYGQPKLAWQGAIEVYKRGGLPVFIRDDTFHERTWISTLMVCGKEPIDTKDAYISLIRRTDDVNEALLFRDLFLNIAPEQPLIFRPQADYTQSLSALETAISADNLAAFKVFLSCHLGHDFRPALASTDGLSPLHLAAVYGADNIIKFLLTNKFCSESFTPFECDTPFNQLKTYVSVPIDLLGPNQETPLMLAARNGHLKTVQMLLNHGADLFLRRIDQNSSYSLAYKYVQTRVCEFLYTEIKRLSDAHHMAAKAYLAYIHDNNILPPNVVQLSIEEISSTFLACVKEGHAFAQLQYAKKMLRVISPNSTQAERDRVLSLLNSASRQGENLAHSLLGQIYLNGLASRNGLTDFNQAHHHFLKAAEANEPNGLYLLAEMYDQGKVPGHLLPNTVQAYRHYERAAKYKFPPAYLRLAEYNYFNKIPEKNGPDYEQAYKYFSLAGHHQIAIAKVYLAEMYLENKVPDQAGPSTPKASALLEEAAQQGLSIAQLRLAQLYLQYQIPVTQVVAHERAFNLLKSAALQSNVTAISLLGLMFVQGVVPGLQQSDLVTGFSLLRVAAFMNEPIALAVLSVMPNAQ